MRQPINPTTFVQRAFAYGLLAAVALAPLMEGVGLYGKFEGFGSEAVARIIKRPRTSGVAVVRITNDDRVVFVGDDKTLRPAELEHLINAIERGGPRSIGIDIKTSDPVFAPLANNKWNNVVWASPAVYSNVHAAFFTADALGGKCAGQCGISTVRTDGDDTVRHYFRSVPVVSKSVGRALPTFNSKLMGASYCDEKPCDTTPRMIDFRLRRRQSELTAAQTLALNSDASKAAFANKVVLVGTDFDGADEHHTPLGWKTGVDVVADVIDTELEGGGTPSPSRLALLGIAAALGYVVWAIFRKFPERAPALALAVVPLSTLAASVLTYRSLAEFLLFVPVMLIVWVQQMYVRVKHQADARTSAQSSENLAVGR